MSIAKEYFGNYSLSIILIALMIVVVSCKEDEPTAQEKNLKLLTDATWNISSVTVNGTDQSALFDGLTINFTTTSYTTTNGEPVWPLTGTWIFTDDKATSLLLDGSVAATIVMLNENTLKLSFTWDKTTYEEVRNTSVAGGHIFTFSK
jgi:hypothetical protein